MLTSSPNFFVLLFYNYYSEFVRLTLTSYFKILEGEKLSDHHVEKVMIMTAFVEAEISTGNF